MIKSVLLIKYTNIHNIYIYIYNELHISAQRTTIRLYNHTLYKTRRWLFWDNTGNLSLTRYCSIIKHNFIWSDS
jgi:hypothetical protein